MSKIVNGLLGYVIGDTMGLPLINKDRKELLNNLVTEMKNDTYGNNTCLVLATMDSILSKHKIDYQDMMNKFTSWFNDSKYTSNGVIFDINETTRQSLIRYINENENPTSCGDMESNDNGSLIRMVPIALYTYYSGIDEEEIMKTIKEATSLTHAHENCIMGCYMYVKYIHFLLAGYDKIKAYKKLKKLNYFKFSENARRSYKRFLTTDIYKLDLDYINSSDYIVNTLEAVIWTFINTNSFQEAIIGSINLGGDSASIGALTGTLAGLSYGVFDFNIQNKDEVINLINKFDKELRLNLLKYDKVFDNYGIVLGNDLTLFIKTSSNSDIYGQHNRYLKIAKEINYKYGLTVIVADNNVNVTIKQDLENVSKYIKGDIYLMGMTNGGALAIQTLYNDSRIKKMLLINTPLMINLHKTKEGISNFKGRLIFVFGSKDPAFNYLPLIQDFRNVQTIVVPGQDHNFSLGDEFLGLPKKYLIK